MALINTADNVLMGTTPVDAVYAGNVKVWPSIVDYGTDWGAARPGAWIPNTVVAPGEQKFAVRVDSTVATNPNVAFIATTASGSYTVDWGDGSAVGTFASGAEATHLYAAGGGQVWCLVEPAAGDTLIGMQGTATAGDGAREVLLGPGTVTAFKGGASFVQVEHIDFFGSATVSDCSQMFATLANLIAVTGQLNTSGVTNFGSMFSDCGDVTTIPDLVTSSGTDFSFMFSRCFDLPSIPAIDTSSGTDFHNMLESCSKLTMIPDLVTSSGINFSYMFSGCNALTALPLLDLSSGTDFSSMFYNCDLLTTIPLLNTSSGTSFYQMFDSCSGLTTVPSLNTSSGQYFGSMFRGCTGLTMIPSLDTSNGTDFLTMLKGCTGLTTIPLLNTSKATRLEAMFEGCTSLTAVPALDAGVAPQTVNMVLGCTSLTSFEAYGFQYNVNVDGCALDAAALDLFLTNLGIANNTTGQQIADVTGNPGALTCDPSIATPKGWSVVGGPAAPVLPPYGGTDWAQRPTDWIPNTILPGEQKIGILIHIPTGGKAKTGFSVGVTGAAGYTVDWGDGTALVNFNTGVDVQHEYERGEPAYPPVTTSYDQTWCIITPQAGGTLTSIGATPEMYGLGAFSCAVEVIVGPGTINYFSCSGYADDTHPPAGFWGLIHVDFLDGCRPTTCENMFAGSEFFVAVEGLDTSLATSFFSMFKWCKALTVVPPLSTSNGTTFYSMFEYCESLTEVPAVDTSNGTNFTAMFYACERLTSVPFYDTSKGTGFDGMFYYCKRLTIVPAYDTSSGTDFDRMFSSCYELTTVPLLNTSNGKTFDNMFNGCAKLTAAPLFDTSNGTIFQSMFNGCATLTTVPLFDLSKATMLSAMFSSCSELTTVPLFNTSSCTTFNAMFSGCSALTDVPLFDTSSGTDFSTMFRECDALTTVPLYDISNGTNIRAMFEKCNNLTTVPALNASASTDSHLMFSNCPSLTSVAAYGFTTRVTVANCALDAAELNTFFTNLGTAVAGAIVYITGNPGTASCDQSLASNKGWTVNTTTVPTVLDDVKEAIALRPRPEITPTDAPDETP